MTRVSNWVWLVGAAAVLGAVNAFGNAGPSPTVQAIANAIAIAERGQAEIATGNVARNNPGDITDGAGNLLSYPTLGAGWQALYDQVSRILYGTSPYYPGGGSMSIMDVAKVYVGTCPGCQWQAWAGNVAAVLGVGVDTPLNQIAG